MPSANTAATHPPLALELLPLPSVITLTLLSDIDLVVPRMLTNRLRTHCGPVSQTVSELSVVML